MPHEPLPPNQQLVAPGKWPIVGEKKPRNDASPWQVEVRGLVSSPRTWLLDELKKLPRVERIVDLHCVTRWSKLKVEFVGVLLSELLSQSGVTNDAKFVNFIARSERNHSTSMALSEALELGTFIAIAADGQLLTSDHGGPLRIIVPGRYFYKSLKWLETIELLAEDNLGYWEAEAGYHNHADPWGEERYLAPNLTKQQIAALLASRDWSGRDLLSICAANHDLEKLEARKSLLRNADFKNCNLVSADFGEANLSNAHLQKANLQNANFELADCEGADFTGAKLQGANFQGCSLFGATLFDLSNPTTTELDKTTRFDAAVFEQLTPDQGAALREQLDRS